MAKKNLIGIIVAVAVTLVGVGGFLVKSNSDSNKKEADKMAMEKKAAESEKMAMEKKAEEAKKAMELEKTGDTAMAKDPASVDAMTKTATGDVMKKEEVIVKSGNYVTLADYKSSMSKYQDSKLVYFFHAGWCSICQGIDKEVKADTSKIPAGVTLIKTDYDSETALRQKYGVTTQYTFVQVGSDGNLTNKYSATSFDKVIAGIK